MNLIVCALSNQLLEKSKETVSTQEQRDQYLAHLQQYTAGYQQLVAEREHLHKQFLQQVQLMDRLQHDEVQGKVQLEQSHMELQQAQVTARNDTIYARLIF